MPDWTQSMQQTFEYYIVNPYTWRDAELLTKVKSSSITWDLNTDTLGSATIDLTDSINEGYIRIYLITIQNGVTEKHPLGTFLVQTLPSSFDGKVKTISADAYTPLIELNEKYPELGYSVNKGTNIMSLVSNLTKNNTRAPVTNADSGKTLFDNFVSDPDDTWLKFLNNLMLQQQPEYEFSLDEYGRILFNPKQEIEALQPIWTYNDDNSSILYPDIDIERDLFGIPNVVEIFVSNGVQTIHSIVKNEDNDSPVSIQNRGREIVYRENNPDINGIPTDKDEAQKYVNTYAKLKLKTLSSLENKITYTHAYCPVRLGDCVRLNYSRFGLNNIKAKVINQKIKCEPGCPVTETAVYTIRLWDGGITVL